jgi:DinB superfamily
MNRAARLLSQLLLALFASACTIESQDNDVARDSDEAADLTTIDASDMLGYLEAKIDIADDKFMQLAEAIPEDLYDWAPMEGVRTFREIFLHIAADNWYGGSLMGVETPDDIGVDGTSESVGAYQDQVLTKAETLVHLRRSFDYFGEALDATRDQLGVVSTMRRNPETYGDLWVKLVTHMHEHLGQTIAYSRANEIVPPWSRND